MKNKNVILSLAVMLASVGTALATTYYVINPVYVHGIKTNGVETCSTINQTCEETGANACLIQVNVTGGQVSAIGYRDNAGITCAVPLRTASTVPFNDNKPTVYSQVDQ